MSNMLLWAHQATLDHDFRLDGSISGVASKLLHEWRPLLLDLLTDAARSTLEEKLENMARHGLEQDDRFDLRTEHLPDPGDEAEAHARLADIMRDLTNAIEDTYGEPEVHIGANPAISALRGAYLALPREQASTLPHVYYVGLVPENVGEQLVKDHEDIVAVRTFDAKHAKHLPQNRPATIGLETPNAKFMLIYSVGRRWRDLVGPDGEETAPVVKRIRSLVNPDPVTGRGAPQRAVLSLGVPHTKEERDLAKGLIRQLKEGDTENRYKVFMSTSRMELPRTPEERRTWWDDDLHPFLQQADILSADNGEIDTLHFAQQGGLEEIPLGWKLRRLDLTAIKVCHAAYGVAMDLGTRPEEIITSESFRKDPAEYLQEVVRLAADGATYAMDTLAGLGRTASEAMIRIYSKQVAADGREEDRFKVTFLDVDKRLPAGMVTTASARVGQTLGAVVGAGAIFDGLLLSFLMRHD